jgi:2,4-dienoyl-CoA reductase-like NADH-dependent reductase (Old Yellow Enzyme family)/thioredoxin reductase
VNLGARNTFDISAMNIQKVVNEPTTVAEVLRVQRQAAMSSDPLLSPFTIKNLTLRNRIVSTSHEPSYSEDGLPKDRYRAYHVEKAKGGVGLTMIGGSSLVSRGTAPAFGNLQLWKDESVHWMRLLTDEVHDHGAAVMIQLSHLGHRTSSYQHEWMPAVSASAVREPAHRAFSKAAEVWDLEAIEHDYVAAAQRCVAAGMDGIELMLYGHFLDSFCTPFWNHRDDEFGGSYENRVRYPLRVIRAIRAAVPDDFIIGARISFNENRPGGLEFSEVLTITNDYIEAGIDIVSGLTGSIESDHRLAQLIPVMGMPSAPQLTIIGEAKRKLDVPMMHAAKIADVPTARYAIEAGLLDLVGMTRALIADPYLPRKIMDKREDLIRPCVGASMCIDGIYTNGAALCIHNPSTGRELSLPQTIDTASSTKNVAVVGGGPGGLEAARILAERGHRVTMFEASDRLGGQLVLAVTNPRRRDLQGIVDWRKQELERLGVEVALNTYVETSDITNADFDVVIVATGGIPNLSKYPDSELAIDGWDVLSGSKRLAGSVLIYDDHGGNQALDIAEAAVRAGCTVEVVTPERNLSPDVGGLVFWQYVRNLTEAGVRFTPARHLTAINVADGKRIVSLGFEDSDYREERVVDSIVIEAGTSANSDLYNELVAFSSNGGEVRLDDLLARRPQSAVRNPDGAFQLFRIGDAVASRNVHAAMLDAARLCYAI